MGDRLESDPSSRSSQSDVATVALCSATACAVVLIIAGAMLVGGGSGESIAQQASSAVLLTGGVGFAVCGAAAWLVGLCASIAPVMALTPRRMRRPEVVADLVCTLAYLGSGFLAAAFGGAVWAAISNG
ncbi:hypothetical protein [Rhodococcus sp. BH5]|uniref:hypothetical protein n=1 Tax=Rhodococcus sp. BH5 TaxID=2871702 RepID=UPI0022CD93B7|nr:hypothetical protein [Rhodococcus sp. BH5]MCZ9635047.1 hypothetical protein [Rhodococcus sp. BH5]